MTPQRPCCQLVGARRATKPQIDPSGIKRGQGAELFGDDQRRVIGQHDSARSQADGGSAFADKRQRHRRCSAGDAGHVVMLRHPEAVITKAFGVARKVATVVQRLAGVAAFDDG